MTPVQRRSLLILAAALLVVSALLMLPEPQEGSAEGLHPLFPGLQPDDISRLGLDRERWREGAVLARTGSGWVLEAPVEARADEVVIGVMLRSLAALEVREALQVEALEPYGLDPSQATVLVIEDATGGRHQLSIGNPTVDGGTYLLVDGEVLSSPSSLGRSVPVVMDELRDKRIWDRSIDGSQQIRILVGDEPLWAAQREAEQGWQVTTGAQSGVDGQEMSEPEALLRYLGGLRVAAFERDWDDVGATRVEVQLLDGDGRLQSLKLTEGRRAVAPCCSAPISPEGGIIESLARYTGLELTD